MTSPAKPSNESDRLKALSEYQLLYSQESETLDNITKLASQLFNTPIVLVSLLYEDIQWFKSKVGLETAETSRDVSFCAHGILQPDDIFLVPDARLDDRFKNNPLVTSQPNIVFYAGASLVDKEENVLGTLCIIDQKPRVLNEQEKSLLKMLAKQATSTLELIKKNNQLEREIRLYNIQQSFYQQSKQLGKIGGWEYDLKQNSVYLTEGLFSILGLPTAFQPKPDFLDALSESSPEHDLLQHHWHKLSKEGQPFDIEARLKLGTGDSCWFRVVGEPIVENDQLVKCFGIFQEIDKQKKQLIEQIERGDKFSSEADFYKSLVENDLVYVIKTDMEGKYTFANNFFIRKFATTHKNVIGRNSMESIYTEDHPKCIEVVQKCIENPEVSHKVLLRKPTKNGLVTNLWDFKAIKDASGTVVEFLCIGYDTSELLEKQQQLAAINAEIEAHNKRLTHFTHIISHDVRTHIANLSSVIYILKQAPKEEQDTYYELMDSCVNNLTETIQNLNDIIKIQTTSELPKSRIVLRSLIDKILRSVDSNLKELDALVKIDVAGSVVVFTNPAYLESILQNLITNAIKYKSEDRQLQVDIGYHFSSNHHQISIQDNGTGLDLAQVGERIFAMYSTFHGNADARGMGLFLSKTQAKALGGEINVESETGKGSTFTVLLPD